jgi:Zn-dependent M28 family amino/carboxypeptidase
VRAVETPVIPAKAGIQKRWTPASAGVTAMSMLLAACAVTTDRTVLRADSDDAYTLAASLVSEVGPRFAGTAGDALAVQWALRKLAELGFQNVRAEPVTVPRWERGAIAVEMLKPRPRALEAVALGGSVATPPGGLEARVLMVGTVEELEAMPEAKVRGRIVFINTRMERKRDGSGYGAAVPARTRGAAAAGARGAVAVLIRSIGTDLHAHTGTVKYDGGPKVAAAALSGPSADALELAFLAGPVTARVALESRELPDAPSANVIGEIPGETGEIVLLGAHLDSWDITPGANDDAAGVGIVVAAARRVAALGTPRRTLRVVLFANEEFGLHGARAYAAAHAAELERHVAVLEADSGSGAPYRLHAWVGKGHWAAVAQVAVGLGLEPGANGQKGGADVSVLRKLGVPELIVAQDASRYFDVHHTAADTVGMLDRDGLARATGAFAVLAHFAAQRREGFGRLPPDPSP